MGKANMFVTISTYLARAGEEDAIIALHEDWQRNQQPRVEGFLSAELLRNSENSREFLSIMRFESEEFVRLLTRNSEQDAWQQRLTSLAEKRPVYCKYTSEWLLTT
jgi:heme-degrading monooxygenase HmoA